MFFEVCINVCKAIVDNPFPISIIGHVFWDITEPTNNSRILRSLGKISFTSQKAMNGKGKHSPYREHISYGIDLKLLM